MRHKLVCLRCLDCCVYGICVFGLKFTVWKLLFSHPVLDGNVTIDLQLQSRDFGIRLPGFKSQFFKLLDFLIYKVVLIAIATHGVAMSLK